MKTYRYSFLRDLTLWGVLVFLLGASLYVGCVLLVTLAQVFDRQAEAS